MRRRGGSHSRIDGVPAHTRRQALLSQRTRWFLGSGLAGALLSAASSAPAAELTARGPEQCPDASELVFRVERAIGTPILESAPLRFRVVFEPPAAGSHWYTARLDAQARDGEPASAPRVLRARDCGRLGDAIAVAIALAIGSSEADAVAASESAAGFAGSSAAEHDSARSDAPPGPDVVDDAATPAQPEPATGTRLSPLLALSALADSGSLPSAGLGVAAGAELRGPQLALRAGGMLLFDQRVSAAAGAAGAEMSLLLGYLSGCAAPIGSYRDSLVLFTCAGWELGQLAATGTGVSSPRTAHQLWSAPRLDLGTSWAVPETRVRFEAQLTLAAPLKRDDFFLRDWGQVHRPPGAVGRLSLGIELSLE